MRRQRAIPEKQVQRQIVNLLRQVGAAVYEIGTRRPRGDYQGTCQSAGIPDLCVFLPRRAAALREVGLWIEVKAKGGKLRPEQAQFREQCLQAGIPHVVGGVDEVIRYLVEGGWLLSSEVPYYRLPSGSAREECSDVQQS